MDKQTALYYQEFAASIGGRYETRKLDFLYDYACKIFPPGGKILEVGCGTGRDGSNLIKRGLKVFPSDGSISMLKELRAFHPELSSRTFQHRLPASLPFQDECLDGCLAIAVLMHLELDQIGQVFKEVQRVLKNQSSFLVSIPTKRSDLDAQFRDENGRLYSPIPGSFFENLAAVTGFRLTHSFQNIDSLTPDKILWTTYAFFKDLGIEKF